MSLQFYTPSYRKITPEFDLAEVAKSYDTLQARHDKAINDVNAYKQALATLPLNAAEDEWKTNQINALQEELNNNLFEGSAAYALDDIVNKYGDIVSNPGLIGRIRANQQYETWKKELDASGLPQDYKDYYKKKNPYYYEDKVNEAGQVVGGTEWKPVKNYTGIFDYSKAMQTAITTAAKEAGGGNSIQFIDANGNKTTDVTQAANALYIDTVSGQWTKLSEDKIKQAFYGILESTPGGLAAVRQDYDIAKDVYKETGDDKYNVVGANGYAMTEKEFVANKINPIASAASYYNYVSSHKYDEGIGAALLKNNEALKAKMKLAGVTGNNNPYAKAAADPTGYTSNPIKYENDSPLHMTIAKTQAQGLIGARYPDINFATSSPNDIKTTIMNDKSLNFQERANLLNAVDAYADANEYLAKATEGMGETKQYFDLYSQVKSGAPIDNKTAAGQEYTQYVNNYFGDAKYLSANITDKDLVDSFVNNYEGGISALNALGITITSGPNGGSQIKLDANKKESFAQWADIVQGIYNSKGTFDQIGNRIKNYVDAGDNISRINDDNTEDIIRGRDVNSFLDRHYNPTDRAVPTVNPTDSFGTKAVKHVGATIGSAFMTLPNMILPFDPEEMFRGYNKMVNRAKAVYNTKLENNGSIYSSVELVNGPSAKANNYLQLFRATGETQYKNLYEEEMKNAKAGLLSAGFTQHNIYELNDENVYDTKATTSKRKQEIQQDLNKYDMNNAIFNTGIYNGKKLTFVRIPGTKDTDNEDLNFAIENFGTDSFDKGVLNEPEIQALSTIKSYTDANIPIRITDNGSFANLPVMKIIPNGHNDYRLQTMIGFNEPVTRNINKEDAYRLATQFYRWRDTYNNTASLIAQGMGGQIKSEVLMNEISSVAPIYSMYLGMPVEDITQMLINNIQSLYHSNQIQ